MSKAIFFVWLQFFYVLFAVVLAQPPRANGIGAGSLSPLRDRIRDRRFCRSIDIRTFTGVCSSETDPSFGMARLPQFSYTDANAEEPIGDDLKSAREISNIICDQEGDIPNDRGINQLFVFFGQFLDHNFAATPLEEEERFDIPVPEGDEHVEEETLPFFRSTRARVDGSSAVRPINILSSPVDLVAVYGPDDARALDLQELENGSPTGKLRVSDSDLLPRNTNGLFNAPDATDDFFIAGDHRSNEHPVLTAVHTLFLREHNRLADLVKERLPALPGNVIFDYARLLNIAQFQKIVYDEFFPTIVGSTLPRYTIFDRRADPTVSDLFAGAAFRFGHTMVGPNIPRTSPSGPISPIPMEEVFFRPADTFDEPEFENIVRGVANSLAQEVDVKIVDTLRNQLFEFTPVAEEGFDLVALNIQRGRDHALPKYNEIREVFGLPKMTSFSDISSDSVTVARLSAAYEQVDDIEAFPGLLAEDHLPGSSFGETMVAVWTAEFTRLRDGDQFFYLRTGAFPREFSTEFRGFIRDLERRTASVFREIILRNTNIRDSQIPSGNVFVI